MGAVILTCASALAQNLFVSGSNANGSMVAKFTWDKLQSTFASGLLRPLGLAFDSTGKLYVADSGTGAIGSVIYEYKPNGVRSIFASGGPNEIFLFLAFQPAVTAQPPPLNR